MRHYSKVKGAIARMKKQKMAAGWQRWQDYMEERAEAEEKNRQRTERVLARFLKSALAKAWATWMEVYEVGRCKLDPSLKAPCFQTLIVKRITVL